ncbi:hypothetical protein PFFVO_00697 [Plasmodium falciparum Vietnam Oak-Knoll (FVO)]|uniref:Sporozoite invasion-associated protein 1 n=1 Tax=Plasmodium falciparum Vietnam Oak-Knoll (FVO) TaxID=1036723 RepID=A0A024VCR0_PLAFA|nr:hypothetical protein PFFVO_00697 [Plasmodium falciparum Vietnam Oak-Knoll (FVO)]
MEGFVALLSFLVVLVFNKTIGYNIKSGNTSNNIKYVNVLDNDRDINTHSVLPEVENVIERKDIYRQINFMETFVSSNNMMHDREKHTSNDSGSYEITGIVDGMKIGHPISVALGSQYSNYFDYLQIVHLDYTNSRFSFTVGEGKYYLRTYGSTYMTPSAIKIKVPCEKCKFINSEYSGIIKIIPYETNNNLFIYNWVLQTSSPLALENINTVFSDEADIIHGYNLSEEFKIDSSAAATSLNTFYGIVLHGIWSSEYAERLLTVISEFPDCVKISAHDKNARSKQRKNQKWILVNEDLGSFDMKMEVCEEVNCDYSAIIHVSKHAFEYSKKLVHNRGRNGRYYSRRVEKILIRALLSLDFSLFITYFQQKHGVTLLDPQYDYELITNMSGYPSNNYQSWNHNLEELVELATSWDEYPKGLQKVQGLSYLLRRKNGTKHPVYPTAPAVAFPAGSQNNSFIEFMESAFVNYVDISHLVIHEVAHFIWVNTVSKELKEKWIQIGQWYKEPLSPSEWATKLEVEFVSAYAHDKNPAEDFAESMATYVLNSKLLNSRSFDKFKWIQDNLFGGGFYITTGTHKFDVINLGNEVYYFPGKVTRVRAKVLGSPTEDKLVKIYISLLSSDGSEGCAKHGYARIFSEQQTFRDLYFHTEDRSPCSHKLYGEFTMNKHESRGRWTAESMIFTGENNIERYVGLGSFHFYLYVNNQNEDVEKPIPLLDSISIYTHNATETNDALLRLHVMVLENELIKEHGGPYASFAAHENKSYSYEGRTYKMYPPEFNALMLKADYFIRDINTRGFREVNMDSCKSYTNMDTRNLKCFQVLNPVTIPKYCIGSTYFLRQVSIEDIAGNLETVNISSDKYSARLHPIGVRDKQKPVVSNVRVSSKPANEYHDGETIVSLSFNVHDNLSGVYYIFVYLRDPHGGKHRSDIDRASLPTGTENKQINHKILLPKGSMGGTWMLEEIKAVDSCKNESRNIYTHSVYVQND